ncbi:hypothetical protein ASG01_00930 [Chryseobacterium sp. Leaf180]|nr:hypothetical protein ASG01_00930 [Chryseobacterium sp. Leaf180]
MLLPDFGGDNLKNTNYSFLVFESDCDYFHKIRPQYRVLFTRTDGKVHTPFLRSHDLTIYGISKMRKSKEDKNVFYISQWDNSSTKDYAAEYKNGKWILTTIGGYDI